jgi:RNA polymerase sigma factor (sigma-70 family)
MAAFTREEMGKLVQNILDGDQDAFKIFYDQYNGVVIHHAKLYFNAIQKAHGNMYEFEDITQELWCFLYDRLKTHYNSEKANIITFLYSILPNEAKMIIRQGSSFTRKANGEALSLDTPATDDDGRSSATMLDFIIDPGESLEFSVIDETALYEDIYWLSKFMETLTDVQKIVYLHSVKKLTQDQTSKILGISRSYVSRLQRNIYSKITAFLDRPHKVDYKRADKFTLSLLSNESDEQVSIKTKCDLAAVKSCREILAEANITS